ncbi:MAG: DUF2058 domain-containing protein [Cocleimonas sp.]|nr:DUF2058 domain-containing protein [Cocleimonas sp.]
MSSLSDQLLKAGLVTKEQVKKATEKPKFKPKQTAVKKANNKKGHNEPSDLAKFYGERKQQENKEKQEIVREKQEATRLKKEMNEKTNKLISDNLLNDESAEIRFNFVVGTSIKYLFVTKEQQQGLVDGKLAITFLASKRSLIPVEIGEEILEINPKKIVIIPASI